MCLHPSVLLPSGELTKSYGKWPFIVDLPMKNGDFPWQNVNSPEGKVVCLNTGYPKFQGPIIIFLWEWPYIGAPKFKTNQISGQIIIIH